MVLHLRDTALDPAMAEKRERAGTGSGTGSGTGPEGKVPGDIGRRGQLSNSATQQRDGRSDIAFLLLSQESTPQPLDIVAQDAIRAASGHRNDANDLSVRSSIYGYPTIIIAYISSPRNTKCIYT